MTVIAAHSVEEAPDVLALKISADATIDVFSRPMASADQAAAACSALEAVVLNRLVGAIYTSGKQVATTAVPVRKASALPLPEANSA